MQAKTKNKLSLIAVAILFLTPVIAAIVMNSKLVDFSPKSFTNYGNFIQPPIKITDTESLKPFEGYWTVVYHQSGVCMDACMVMFDTINRIRLTKGHKMKKIKLLVLHPENNRLETPAQFAAIQQQSYAETDKLKNILTELSAQSLGNGEGLYLLAPEGFLMMSYPQNFKPQDVISDLGLLLRARKSEG
ncbi:hypothetical protein MNBD_GAMMA01-1797 [hydrothermal vent metagenome]|uniref:Cytochrome oxidase biogenesis protein Sco1/SenC/PrrC, thiol-disulfide reductase involved in Cu(I) insertion into CoxII Cu(A) center n=1 Tax=hydrothermal vent metagenome TaxID=652676 RepID=A0A3B0UQL7_9ZZZZ